jgi:hypothetical protein
MRSKSTAADESEPAFSCLHRRLLEVTRDDKGQKALRCCDCGQEFDFYSFPNPANA